MQIKEKQRECGTCTACCEGWLHAQVHSHNMYRGKPCFYLGEGKCSIYKDRPHEPCVTYKCAWLHDADIPRWLKPDQCGVILTWRVINGIRFLDATEMSSKMDASVLSWMMLEHINKQINIRYTVDGGQNWIGSREFIKAITGDPQPVQEEKPQETEIN